MKSAFYAFIPGAKVERFSAFDLRVTDEDTFDASNLNHGSFFQPLIATSTHQRAILCRPQMTTSTGHDSKEARRLSTQDPLLTTRLEAVGSKQTFCLITTRSVIQLTNHSDVLVVLIFFTSFKCSLCVYLFCALLSCQPFYTIYLKND